jgi:hypothetical protein
MVYAHLQEQVPNTTKKHNNRWLPGLPQLTTRAEVFPDRQKAQKPTIITFLMGSHQEQADCNSSTGMTEFS